MLNDQGSFEAMKITWERGRSDALETHNAYVGSCKVARVFESAFEDIYAYQCLLPSNTDGILLYGKSRTLSRAKFILEAAIEEWFEATGEV